nr:putative ribonuclease H-like domain-containing protein [Tanacetum cinerariifolium]
SQSSGSQIKFEDINQINEDDIGRRDTYRQGSKAEEQTPKALMAIDEVGWDWSYMANDEEYHSLVAKAPTEFKLMANTTTENKVFDNSLCSKDCKKNNDSLNSKITYLTDKLFDAKNMIYHYKLALAQVESRLVEYKERDVKYIEKIKTLEFYDKGKVEYIETLKKELETLKQEKEVVDGKLAGLLSASKDLDNLIESQRSDKSNEGLGYTAVPPLVAQLYLSPKKDLSWTGLPECADDIVTDYSRPSPIVESSSDEDQNINPSAFENVASPSHPNNLLSPTADMKMKGKAVKSSACWSWKPLHNLSNKGPKNNSVSVVFKKYTYIDTQGRLNGCSRHMTGNISYLYDYEPFDEGYVSFGQGGCKIIRKGTIKTSKLEFENVYFVKDLKYNLFSVSQIYDTRNSVLFTDSECIVLGRDFKLLDNANILLRTPRKHNMYSIDLNNIVPHRDLTCLVTKASADECNLWHRRLGHLNFKTTNNLVRYNLVRGLPTKYFENDHNCTACLKGKQHKASCKSKLVTSVTKPLHTLHMDLFGPTFVSSINHKWYCLVVTDEFSRFTWTFFLRTKDETSSILRKFITEIENLKDLKVKIIRCDNRGEFRNKELDDFCSQKGIKRDFSNARTPQKNGVAGRRNRSLIEAARTM